MSNERVNPLFKNFVLVVVILFFLAACDNGSNPSGKTNTFTGIFTINFEQITDNAPVIDSGIVLFLTDNSELRPLTGTIEVSDAEKYTSINWRVQDTDETGTGPVFTLSAANTAYNLVCEHFVTVTVYFNSVPYSKTVSFNILY